MRRETCIICNHLSVFPPLKGKDKLHVYQSTPLGRKGDNFVDHVNEKAYLSCQYPGNYSKSAHRAFPIYIVFKN